MGLTKDKIHIILNRAKSVGGIETKEVEKTLRHPVCSHIVSGGRSVVSSVNRGMPLVMKQPGDPISQQFLRL
ncbi:MAG: response regulator receiver protein, partial [Nitrospiraceae bacterium]